MPIKIFGAYTEYSGIGRTTPSQATPSRRECRYQADSGGSPPSFLSWLKHIALLNTIVVAPEF